MAAQAGVRYSIENPYSYLDNNLVGFINIIESGLGKTATKTMLPMQLGDVEKTYADITKIQTDFNFKPSTSIKLGVPKFLEWYKKYHKL